MRIGRSGFGLCMTIAGVIWTSASAEPAEQPTPEAHWLSDTPQVFTDNARLHYYGTLNEAGVGTLRAALETAPDVREVHIASPGGHLDASIAIGEQIHSRGLAVVVVGAGCFSGCANYVFTPAVRRTISPGSLVMWHYSCPARIPDSRRSITRRMKRSYGTAALGFSWSDEDGAVDDPQALRQAFDQNFDDLVDSYLANVRTVRAGHQRIFEPTGIDDRIICLTDHLRLPTVDARHVDYLYTLSPDDMARFGVCDVEARPDYAEWAARHIADDDGLSGYAGVVRLAEHPRFRPRPARACADAGQTAGPGSRRRWIRLLSSTTLPSGSAKRSESPSPWAPSLDSAGPSGTTPCVARCASSAASSKGAIRRQT